MDQVRLTLQVPETIGNVRSQICRSAAALYEISERYNGSLVVSKPIWYRNDFAPVLHLDLEEAEGATVIHARLGMRTWVRLFSIVWLAAVVIALMVASISVVSEYLQNTGPLADLKFTLIPIGMIVFYYLIVKFSRYIARDNSEELVDWLKGIFANSVVVRGRAVR